MPGPYTPRDPAWIRAVLRALVEALVPETPKDDEGERRARLLARLDAPVSDHERAACQHVSTLQSAVGLSSVEADILLLAAAATWVQPLDGLLGELTASTRVAYLGALARALGASFREVRAAVAADSLLHELAELDLHGDEKTHLCIPIDSGAVSQIGDPDLTPDELLAALLPSGAAPRLTLADFAWLGDAVPTAVALLRGAVQGRARGIHVAMVGPPGVGKSELAAAIVAAAGARAVDCPTTWTNGAPREAYSRLSAWTAAQRLLARSGDAVVVFDEAEDAITRLVGNLTDPGDRVAKGAFTRMLEESAAPTLWIANDMGLLDGAYRRRLTLVVEVRNPPAAALRSLASDRLAAVDPDLRAAAAAHPDCTPAVLTQAAKALTLCGDAGITVDRTARVLLQGHLRSAPLRADPAAAAYDPTLVELGDGVDAAALAARLGRAGFGRLLLHGPPGTGKSAFARHVADVSGRPLHAHTAAQLLSMYVGGTEKALASAFRDASDDGAVLVLDEADALLFGRSNISHSWEASQVAQALVEVERFDGILIATSNLLTRIDTAFHRRFDLVLEVGPPGPARRLSLLQRLAADLGLPAPTPPDAAGLRGLVPGHLSQLRRRFALVGPPTTLDGLLTALREVVAGPGPRAAKVGFSAVA